MTLLLTGVTGTLGSELKKLFPDFKPINLIDGIKEIYNKKIDN